MSDILAAVSSLSPERRALLASRNPLSFPQQRLWFLEQLGGAGAAYHLPFALRLVGHLDVPVLQRALDEVVSRHEALRATFVAPDGEPIQIFNRRLPVPLRVTDGRGVPEAERESALTRWLAAEAGEPFDLAQGALRAGLRRLRDDEQVLAVTMHHIVSDGWSMNLFIREMAALYAAFSRGEASPLPQPSAQYGAFVRWQRERLQGQRLAAELAYWSDRLAGAPPVLELPLDRPRPRIQSFRGATHRVTLGAELTSDVRGFSREAGTTTFMTVLAAFTALASRLAGQDDVVLGTPVANRLRAELEGAIGLFINTLVLRTSVDPGASFRELLRRVRTTVLDAQAHQEVPFEKIVQALQPERRLSHAPLFQVLFTDLVNDPEPVLLPDLALVPIETAAATSRFDLTLSTIENGGSLVGIFEYNTDLFDAATIVRLAERFRTLLAATVRNPELRLFELPLLLEDERRELLVARADADASATSAAETIWTTVCAAVERRAAEDGGRRAVTCEGRDLTYAEVNRRANQIAHGLRRLGVAPGDRVALYLERSLEMVPALLGILKAGGAYVPLDPEHPRERIGYVLDDCRPALVLTQARLAPTLQASCPVAAVDDGAFDGEPEVDPAARVTPDHLAYVIYTSGSTGRPKGVQVSHRALWNLLASMAVEPGLSADDALLAVTTLTFDISLLELLLPLSVGARVIVAAPGVAADGDRLAELIDREAVTAMQATPSGWRVLVEAGWAGSPSLRMLCGGEALPPELAVQLLARGGELWNVYGPTETTIWSAVHRVAPGGGPVPLGHPVARTEIHVLDSFMTPQPFGVPGEVYIGGTGLSSGYLGRATLTAERFVPHPFAARGGERLYRTGDLARRRTDGSLEFLGRTDEQVKVRGFRIELGEVEAVLREHPDVREAVVVLRRSYDGSGEGLAAYANSAGASGRELLSYLRGRLPAYMVPSTCTVLPALPRTPSGKVDRARLPAEDAPAAVEELIAPRTPLEEAVAEAWGEALGHARVSVHANFFELGGHSLLATRVMHRLRRELGVGIPLHALFEHPTVAELAVEIARRRASPDGSAAVPSPIVPDPERRYDPFPLTEVQQAYWVGRSESLELGNVASHAYTEFELHDVDIERLERALRGIIDRHEMLRAVVLRDGRQQILREVPPYRIDVTDLRGADPTTAASHLARVRDEMSHEVLPADRWPLFGVRASLLSDDRVRIHFSLDYLIADAWSTRIIFDELAERYADPELRKADLRLSFRDCVLAAYGDEGSEAHRRAETYWRERLADLPAAPELPLAASPEQLVQPRFVRRTATLDAPRWEGLKALAARAGLTPSGVLLAAFAEVLAAWSKNRRFTLNLTLFNRPPRHAEIDEVVGDFTALTLLGIDASRGDTFELRARRIQEQLWRDMEHGSVSGVQVLRDLARLQGRPPTSLMPVVFTSTLGQRRRASGGGLAAAPDALEGETPVYAITQTPQVWLDHQAAERDGALVFNWDAVEELFCTGVLDAMWASYRELLARLAMSDEAWRDGVGARLPAEQLARRAAANATVAPVPAGLLHDGFEAQARDHGARLAVVSGERRLTYAELERRSRALGLTLRARGARPNRLVAVVMEKGWEQVVAVLGIVRSGAAYLPIDAALPPERIAQLLVAGEVTLAVVQPAVEARLAWPADIARICVEAAEPALDAAAALPPVQGPEDLAYVIFTSGSTGVPKGVMIDHRGALNTVVDINARFAVGPDDRVLGLSALNFDLSVYDVFGLLAAGGALVLPDAEASRDPETWAELTAREGVTLWNSVPALMEMMAHYAADRDDPRLASLRVVLLSGDWIPVTLPARIRAVCPRARLVSLGGATEASIWSILYPIEEVRPEWASIPYGAPMVNQRFHVLDEALAPRPAWVPGHLYIGGIGLAQGYWGDAEKTAASFVIHPHTGERLYRTGDLGRYLPDGSIEFLGREDFQVKVQGHRIELGEIESVLEQHPAVRTAVAAAVGERTARRLVAYATLNQDGAASPDDLRAFLAARLPAYMVPASIAILDAFPLSSNGKVDRSALARLAQPADETAPQVRPARAPTPLEERIAAVWSEILRVGEIPVDANLFELGGNSILAVRIVNRLHELLDVEVPLRQLFRAPTVEGVAAVVRRIKEERVRESERSLQEHAITPDVARRHEPFPLNDVQHAYWLGRTGSFQLGNVAAHSYNEYDARGLDLDRLHASLARLIARHDMLRAVMTTDGQQRILPEVPPYRIALLDLRDRPADDAAAEREALRHRMSHQVLPADRWPLFEIVASVVDDVSVRLHTSMDILFVDAWSARIIWHDLARFYEDASAVLPPLELSFRDYVLAEIAFRESPQHARSQAYWWERAASLPPAPDLPLAKDPGAIEHPRFVRRAATLSRELWEGLKARSASAGLTPSGVLMAAYAETLAQWSRIPCFTLNLTLFNRLPLHPQVNEVVGDHTTLNLLAVDASRGDSFEVRARAIQEQLWDDLEHRFVGGVAVLREMSRRQQRSPATVTSVVFTSNLFGDAFANSAAEEGGPRLEHAFGVSQTPQVWLDHQAAERDGALVFNWDAVEELFCAGVLDAMWASYRELLARLATSDEAWRDGVGARLPAEQLARRATVNATAAPVPAGLLHDGFEAQARDHGARLAVVSGERRLTYAELERRSRALGLTLRARGARPNQLVAVVMEKGWEQVVAVLGIVRSGAAYLPIDAALPPERIAQLLAAGEVTLAVVQPAVEARLAWPAGIARICVEVEEPALDAAAALPAVQGPEDLAYVIFTSGSTGVPKGVMIDHRGALNTVVDVNARFAVGPDDRVLGLSALNFDLSVYDVFGLLAAGGALVLPDAEASRDPETWAELTAREGVTLWNSVPALMEMMAHYAADRDDPRLASLRVVLLSGDWIPVTLPARIRAVCPRARLVSLGGATEASIWSILYPIEEVRPEWASIPYGAPMVNQRFHVLDDTLAPRPAWVPGHLYIGGIGLAQGYWGDAEKTAASFVIHPDTGERLYRTGDLGRYLPDGSIEFLGREDFQVKVQGHRIELGEIESVLEQHPAVRTAVAAAVGERTARRLIAYATLKEGALGAASASKPGGNGFAPRLARTLASLRQVRVPELPLPKYGYPSAGNLYPVQTYVAVPSGIDGISASTYYHDPRGNRLVRVAPALPDDLAGGADGPVVFLVARLEAIAPIYGEMAPDFSLLEAGYMQVLLAMAAAGEGLAATAEAITSPEDVRRHLGLDAGYVPLQCLRLAPADAERPTSKPGPRTAWDSMSSLVAQHLSSGAHAAFGEVERLEFKLREPGLRSSSPGDVALALDPAAGRGVAAVDDLLYRNSDREFLHDPLPLDTFRAFLETLADELPASLAGVPADGLSVVLHFASGAVEGLAPGSYRYDLRSRALSLVVPSQAIPPHAHAEVNRAVFERARFSLFLCSTQAGRDASLLLAGGLGQALMVAGPALGVGLCPIGTMHFDRVRPLFGLDADAVLLHSFVGGRISPRARPAPRAADPGPVADTDRAEGGRTGIVLDATEVAESLRQFLAGKLPDYMVPKRIVVLDEFPLTANGKVDRKTLPRIDEFDAPAWVAPRTGIEEQLSEIWRELLGVERVGVEDSFFALGGDSVKGIQFLTRAREAGFEIAVRDFFQNPSIAALARFLSPREDYGGPGTAGSAAPTAHTPVVSDAELTQEELDQLIAEFDTVNEDPIA